jgi:hypothetical protein
MQRCWSSLADARIIARRGAVRRGYFLDSSLLHLHSDITIHMTQWQVALRSSFWEDGPVFVSR